ncbi:MAG: phosphatidylserine decarboxylase family protein [Flavobacteriales bacterium]|jgi:phosphatidylserine decarboxylase|nr:phosphatidylserine decarboxylase family protein [Flavobacteriales bacterium]
MKLHKEGTVTLILEILVFSLFNYLAYTYASKYITCFTSIVTGFLFIMTLNFFRIPKREFERKEGVVYAPCDGKVVVIEEIIEQEYYKDKRIQVSIFMSPLNVHNQLYPISGAVKYTKYHPGKFLVAWHPKASTENERSTVVVENNKITVLFRQIAGALARRIVTYSTVDDKATVADEYGFIKFGSRVDLYLPIGTKINTQLEQKVTAGESIIAIY